MSTVYKMKVIEKDWQGISDHYDCFLAAGGSDIRAYEVLRKAYNGKAKIDEVLLFSFEERIRNLSPQLSELFFSFKNIGFGVKEIPCSINDPSGCLKSLAQYEIDLSKYRKLAIDISCFTKPYYFLIMKHLQLIYDIPTINVFYTEPKSYLFQKGLYDSYQSSYGPIKVLEIPGYTGSNYGGKRRLLVTLLGFDGDLSREINEDVAPEEIIAVNGFPGYEPKFKDISLICNEKLIGREDSHICYSKANNPFEAYNLLDNLRKQYGDYFLNIAPLGTKPMALGACLFAIHNPDVRIVYPMPQNYIKVTTDRCWHSWVYEIPLIMDD